MVNSKTLRQLTTYFRVVKAPTSLRFIAQVAQRNLRFRFLYGHFFSHDVETYRRSLGKIYMLLAKHKLTINTLVRRVEGIEAAGLRRKRRKSQKRPADLHQLLLQGLSKQGKKLVSLIEEVLCGRWVPTLPDLMMIAKALDVSVAEIFSPSPEALQAFQKALKESVKNRKLSRDLSELRLLLELKY